MKTLRSATPKAAPANRHRETPTTWLLLALIGVVVAGASCRKQSAATKPADVDYYTCTMHPSVRSQKPDDKCPICSMNLVPVMKKKTSAASEPRMGENGHDHAKM